MSLLKLLGSLILVISLLVLIFMILVFIKHLSGFWFDFVTIFFLTIIITDKIVSYF
nr:MAG TPA: hypothetical protein [Caudoviricetes sp.]